MIFTFSSLLPITGRVFPPTTNWILFTIKLKLDVLSNHTSWFHGEERSKAEIQKSDNVPLESLQFSAQCLSQGRPDGDQRPPMEVYCEWGLACNCPSLLCVILSAIETQWPVPISGQETPNMSSLPTGCSSGLDSDIGDIMRPGNQVGAKWQWQWYVRPV